ncbi:MAG: cysteine desulfurase [Patescibacteria group bacterium]
MIDISTIRDQFPGITRDVVYLDNAATTQMHRSAIEAMEGYWRQGRANVGRGLYPLAESAMKQYESARTTIAEVVGADASQCVFTKSVTEGLNTLAFGLRSRIGSGDEILISPFEHHANILPWRRIAKERGATVRVMPMMENFELDFAGAQAMINERTKIVAVTLVSNVLGAVLPIAKLAHFAHQAGATLIVDAAQAVAHIPVSMRSLGVDAIVFGAHKMYGPTGIGALVMAPELIESLEPMILGGGMVDLVTDETTTWREGIQKFEGGSPNVEAAIGWAAAAEALPLLTKEGPGEVSLRSQLVSGLVSIPGVTVFNPPNAIGIVAFSIDGLHPHDVADFLGAEGICVRAGNHCAAPLVQRLSENGVLRASLGVYNDEQDVDRLLEALPRVTAQLR